MSKPATSNYIPVSSAVKLIGTPEGTIRGWIRSGKIKSKKVGGRIVVQRKSLQRYHAQQYVSVKEIGDMTKKVLGEMRREGLAKLA